MSIANPDIYASSFAEAVLVLDLHISTLIPLHRSGGNLAMDTQI